LLGKSESEGQGAVLADARFVCLIWDKITRTETAPERHGKNPFPGKWCDCSFKISVINFENARPRSGFPRSRLEPGHWEKRYLSVVESGDRRGRIKAGEICAIGSFWGAISACGYVRTRCRDPDIGKYCRSVS
jgi:hypothetical protein